MAIVETAHRAAAAEQAWAAARSASQRAGVEVRPVTGLEEVQAVCRLFGQVWATHPDAMMPVGALRALVHAGGYAVGAYDVSGLDGRGLVAAGVGLLGERDGTRHLHSHILGVATSVQGRSVGFAVKQHQRAWALEHDIAEVQWTFDPLVRRNGWFNVAKLGATVAAYYPDFYGVMADGINGADATDRGLVVWDLAGLPAVAASQGHPQDGVWLAGVGTEAVVVLEEGPQGRPAASPGEGELWLARVPSDVVALRAAQPERAHAWRLALRETFLAAEEAGLVVSGMTRAGYYVFAPAR